MLRKPRRPQGYNFQLWQSLAASKQRYLRVASGPRVSLVRASGGSLLQHQELHRAESFILADNEEFFPEKKIVSTYN